MKTIAILGSTGSIGTQTLEVAEANGDLRVAALAAGSNVELLERQIRKFHPKLAALASEEAAKDLRVRVRDLDVRIVSGMEGLIEVSVMPETDILVTAIVGMIGIRPTIAAIEAGKDIALANKETLVTAGHIIMPLAKEKNVRILPVDSEHSAVFQALNGENGKQVSRILLTASGGPFRGKTRKELENVQPEDALKHPNWAMGQKITIDSATLVNKGLEVMEAKWLFGAELEQIEVVVQPQSVIHSMVEFTDGAVMAQLGTPDMKLPIQYALYYPERRYLGGERLDFGSMGRLTFEEPDEETFLGLPLAFQAARDGGSMPTVFNAANECAVSRFLHKQIRFLDIYEILQACMEEHHVVENPAVEEILAAEQMTYEFIENRW
ncbi:1-deoxy-D-xylulose-5-phosphate reductoisomerase [Hominisplanchenecus murintestinalis]|jgi:1-deoxy-D-xylulose-5-phosphate reductoisomerase|uniref:1-deoxy-D-xylulose-5-phosphate reductoisomerase n=1 Tax=Hominisplanchenecus murintestinalis TaxID=2941517 RepID=UPI000EA0A418|nr:1-deoxy-D-xylulose-5-phosphate reductoisomerase [Hominisplanchenecus murintestinalis]NBH99383.1 1-deoxy-D-xylulose-5-phosphate reductoisomerase [Lachnospiraceae bacterium]NBI76637.1 1-deoxy-D-xylulose-5-phosphate reductoisomerase [Lachnospiraceae bacterium]RKJ78835.1 1-deoxy-D-xylulose-5-phosphate reductoisomerase [Anaerotruncus sp. 1XD22-93]